MPDPTRPGDAPSGDLLDSRGGLAAPRPAELPPPPPPGTTLGEYRLEEQVGAGGFSIVWRARHLGTGETVALKLPRAPEFLSHLTREAVAHSWLRHPQVVGIREVRLDQDPPFLVMPFVPGSDLLLPEAVPDPRDLVLVLRRFRQIAQVVASLHEAGLAHGDLKPGNIRIDPSGTPHLLDLGLARLHVSVRQQSTLRASIVSVIGEKIAGTLDFMAPELISGGVPDRPADVFALGVILHTMLCGRPPAFGVSPDELNPFLPPGCGDFLRQMLEVRLDRRPADARELLGPLDGFIRAEERCLRRRNGHARRRVFRSRLETLTRGARVLAAVGGVVGLVLYGWPQLEVLFEGTPRLLVAGGLGLGLAGFIGILLGMTTLNAWIAGVPERVYKDRRGHPWWTFMMQ